MEKELGLFTLPVLFANMHIARMLPCKYVEIQVYTSFNHRLDAVVGSPLYQLSCANSVG